LQTPANGKLCSTEGQHNCNTFEYCKPVALLDPTSEWLAEKDYAYNLLQLVDFSYPDDTVGVCPSIFGARRNLPHARSVATILFA
jgi:hypothetical protein